ncbi:MAG: hypothetical protein ABI783_11035 [Actinomycetota bacterium]
MSVEVATARERHRKSLKPPGGHGSEEDGSKGPSRLRRDCGAVGQSRCLAEPAHYPTG